LRLQEIDGQGDSYIPPPIPLVGGKIIKLMSMFFYVPPFLVLSQKPLTGPHSSYISSTSTQHMDHV